ncbi:unnamed protein product [Rhizoctonia solani]|uniref:rRNA-processing protein FYV7 n=3 Tax=Rhizoctonia solani TaxID=456999 RepID=A0A8H3A4Q1_9AGAM|nr:hypothetical protein RSOL_413720 [Rhizoctonia solani AG-3 Rhs1AP]KEP52992.1 hypothetical protein V565_037170 [Rhizoctonia solani 123E]CAE6392457.1 unnamed protein product [Rhizoctonia solani]CAE6508340.1 unnamed protein product [Rhizoctonia solani]
MAPPAPKKSRTAPKFNAAHLDPHRARKLKKEWIATQKLKAKYRAEKRRMGLKKSPEEPNGDAFDGNAGGRDDIAKAQLSDTESLPDNLVVEPDTTRRSPPTSTYPDTYPKPGSSKPTPSKPAISRRNTKTVTDEDNPKKDGPSLRELAKEAYSPASLHTFKSHPLRRRPQGLNSARAQVNPYPNRSGANGQRGAPRGRGQPNMAKRMGVLLEKIKRSN